MVVTPEPTTSSSSSPRGTQVRKCTCANQYQDLAYGPRMRVMNARKGGWRCTVCGREDSGK